MDRVDRMADILYGVASGRGVIEYVPLGRRLGVQPHHLGRFLEQVSARAADREEPLWSALVVSKDSGLPSSGFYILARRLRDQYAHLDDQEVWQQERARCYDAARSS